MRLAVPVVELEVNAALGLPVKKIHEQIIMNDLLAVARNGRKGKRESVIELVVNVAGLTRPVPHAAYNLRESGRKYSENLIGGNAWANFEQNVVKGSGNEWLIGLMHLQGCLCANRLVHVR